MEKFQTYSLKIVSFVTIITFFISCDLDEYPPFMDNTLYSDPQSAEAARDGIYAAFTHYNAMEQRMFVENGYSGLFTTRRGGNKLSSVWMNGVMKLKPNENVDNQNTWIGLYRIISRANAAIDNSTVDLNSTDPSQLRINDVVGHAYFSRSFAYFSLTRLWGDIPVWTSLPEADNTNKAKTPSKEVYKLIIDDAKQAKSLLNGAAVGFPKAHAAQMLLAKVYMLLATNPDLHDDDLSELDYWNLAYSESKDIYLSG